MVIIAVLPADSSGGTVLRMESTVLVIKVVIIQKRMDRNT